MTIAFFPTAHEARPAAPPPDREAITLLRRSARRSQITRRLDLDRLCADPTAGDREFWGVALLQAASRARPLSFHRAPDAEATESECWIARLIAALRDGDAASARFIVERHVRKAERRLTLCFAQRLLEADAATARCDQDGGRTAIGSGTIPN
jgi:hypothetical protein